jgi:SnoaL-like domain
MPTNDRRKEFAEFRRLGADGRDWAAWAGLFAPDARYIEHCMGSLDGQPAIAAWIAKAMEPVACMTFSIDWLIFDGDRVAFWIWNHLPDPRGASRPYDFGNLSILTYDGDALVCEEDFYSANDSERTVVGWYKAGGKPTMLADPSLVPHAPFHPPMGEAVERLLLDGLADRIVNDDWRDVVSSYTVFNDQGGKSLDDWARSKREERYRIVGESRVIVVFDHVLRDGRRQPASVIADLDQAGHAGFLDHCYNPRELS